MEISKIVKKHWCWFIIILFFIILIPFLKENLNKVLIIYILFFIWLFLGKYFKNFSFSSIIIILLALPFNITYQIPNTIGNLVISEPIVNGVIVNYLIPTISILDIGVFLLLLSLIFERRVNLKWNGVSFIKIYIIFAIFLVIQNVFLLEFISFFSSIRLLLYIFTFYQLYINRKELFKRENLSYILLISLILVLIQGVISFIQFTRGSSIGLSFLGESQVASGMRGSSFTTLNNQLFLRGYGTFPHPNILGGWLFLNMVLGWYLFSEMNKKRDYSIILMILSMIVALLTFSRLSVLVIMIIWFFFVFDIIRRRREKVFNIAFPALLFERAMNLLHSGDSAWSDRLELIKVSWRIIRENFLLGVGLSRFVANMGEEVPRTDKGILLLQPVHNVFLLLFSELGIIGSMFFLFLLSFFLKKGQWNLRRAVVLLCVLLIFLFDHYLFTLPQGQIMFFLTIFLI